MQSQIAPGPTVVKIFDGKSWNVRGLIRNDPYWDELIREFQSEKPYYSHGSCCYNEKFKNGLRIEAAGAYGSFFIDDASQDGPIAQFKMYRSNERNFKEFPNERGYVQTATKKLSEKIRNYIGDHQKMAKSINDELRSCAGHTESIFGPNCRYSYPISDITKYNQNDSSKNTTTIAMQVFVNPKTRLKHGDSWTTVIDSLGIIVQVPKLAIQEYDSLASSPSREAQHSNAATFRNNSSLVAWAISRYQCVIIDKNSNTIKKHIIRIEEIRRCGNMCDSYSQYIYLNGEYRILEKGWVS